MTIFNLGSINIDHVYRLDHMPAPGETLASRDYAQGLGGKGANQSVAAARAGAHVIHIGAIAAQRDEWVLDRLSDCGVDVSAVARTSFAATGHAIILVDSAAENAIILHGGANRRIEEDHLSKALSGITSQDTVLIQNETNLQVEAARIAHDAGARVSYSSAPFDPESVRAILPYVSVLALNEIEAEQLAASWAEQPDVPAMLVTRGVAGAQYRDLKTAETTSQPAFAVAAVDTTGAGDCFAGYFAAGLDLGRSIAGALRDASAAAAIKVTRSGAGDAIPEAAEVLDFLTAQGR